MPKRARPGTLPLLVFGILYYAVPFIACAHRYSDRLGFEAVPAVDDLYVARVARVDLALLLAGTVPIVLDSAVALPAVLGRAGDALVAGGLLLAAANLLLVVCRHAVAPAVTARLGGVATSRER